MDDNSKGPYKHVAIIDALDKVKHQITLLESLVKKIGQGNIPEVCSTAGLAPDEPLSLSIFLEETPKMLHESVERLSSILIDLNRMLF